MPNVSSYIKKTSKSKNGDNISIGKNSKMTPDKLILHDNVEIGNNVTIIGGKIELFDDVKISDNVIINVKSQFILGSRSVLGKNFKIEGRSIAIGNDFWSDENCVIGGGSCFENHSSLKMGYYCHMGAYSFINTARPVVIGNEVGLGMRTSLFTHGVYLSILKGFPVEYGPINIGDNCWIPSAIINPNVKIGSNTVIAVGSVVTNSIPSGCLAGGIPARVIRKYAYPRRLSDKQINKVMQNFLKTFSEITSGKYFTKYKLNNKSTVVQANDVIILFSLSKLFNQDPKQRFIGISVKEYEICSLNETFFNIRNNTIVGRSDHMSELLRNQFRRFGVRFKVTVEDGQYVPWG